MKAWTELPQGTARRLALVALAASLSLPAAVLADTIPAGTPFLLVPASDFQVAFGDASYVPGKFSRRCAGTATSCRFLKSLELPYRSEIVGIELDACDMDSFNKIRVFVVEQFLNEGMTSIVAVVDTQVTDGPCQFFVDVLSEPKEVLSFSAEYYLEVYILANDIGGGDPPPEGNVRFQAVRVYYQPGDGQVIPEAGSGAPVSD